MEISYAKSRPLGFAQDKKKDGHIFYIKDSADYENKVLKSTTPVVMDFYADWCPPCKKLLPLLEAKVNADGGKWHLYKINTDDKGVAALCQKFKISGIPHIAVIKGGKVRYSQAGGMGAKEVDALIEEFVDN
jgi:thioredoxin 1